MNIQEVVKEKRNATIDLRRNHKWDKCVNEAKLALKQYKEVRLIITDLAIDACDIFYGQKTDSVYTVKRFAKEIGISFGTLYEWIRIKQNVIDKLPKDRQNEDFAAYRATLEKIKHDSSKKEVLTIFSDYQKKPREHKKFEKYIKHLKTIKHNAERPAILKSIDRKLIRQTVRILDETAVLLNQYLNTKQG